MEISSHILIRQNYQSHNKPGGVCTYHKKCLAWRVLSMQLLQECITFQLEIGDKICNFVSLYKSLRHSHDEFEFTNFELSLGSLFQNKLFLVLADGDFLPNQKSSIAMTKIQSDRKCNQNVT